MKLGMSIVGACLVNRGRRHGFINIPICASTLVKKLALAEGYEYVEQPYEYDSDLTFTVVVREPWERYASGLSEYVGRYYDLTCNLDDMYRQLFETGEWVKYDVNRLVGGENAHQIIFDEHTAPQHFFVEPFQKNRIDFVKMDRGNFGVLNSKLRRYLNVPNLNASEHVNPPEKRMVGVSLGRRLLRRGDGWLNAWSDAFFKDEELWRKAR